jgi:hypothetical protein
MCDDKGALVAYLYDEVTDDERRAMDAHLATCAACRDELASLGAVRGQLGEWAPPEQVLGFRIVQGGFARAARAWWRAPAWGLAAAAVLLLAVSAAIAHVEIRYDDQGFVVRTGWGAAAPAPVAAQAAAVPVSAAQAAPWQGDLRALEARLQQELANASATSSAPAAVTAAAAPSAGDDAALLRQVRALIEASEARQQRELALRIAQVVRDVGQQRRADWTRIQAGFGRLEDLTGAGMAQQREVLNYLVRTSQKTVR